MENIEKEHTDMVALLAKPGEDILKTLTPQKAHIWHMAIGVAGEVAEIRQALLKDDKENLLEELGDLEFYIKGFLQVFPLSLSKTPAWPWDVPAGDAAAFEVLYNQSNELLDLTKKWVVYNKEVNPVEMEAAVYTLCVALDLFYKTHEIDRSEALEHNVNKLLTSKNARYKDGYSDEQAQQRRDKPDGE